MRKFVNGHAKVGGRVKGKSMAEKVKEMCLQMAPDMIQELHRLATDARQDSVRVAAISQIIDRGLGRPSQQHTVEGNIAHSFEVITHAALFDAGGPVIEDEVLPAITAQEEDKH